MMRRIEEIEAAFRRVRSSAEKAIRGDEAAKDQSFQDIFALNNEIGKLAREQPDSMPKMKELQVCVNLITVGLKYDRTEEVREGISVTEKAIKVLGKQSSSAP